MKGDANIKKKKKISQYVIHIHTHKNIIFLYLSKKKTEFYKYRNR